MNIKNSALKNIALGMLSASILASCSKNNSGAGDHSESETTGNFFIATVPEGDAGGDIILTASQLDSGSISTAGSGIELTSHYVNWPYNSANKTVIGLAYNQGDPGQGIFFKLNETGNLVQSGSEVQIPDRFTSYGPFGNYEVTSVGSYKDSVTTPGVLDTVSVFNFFDLTNGNSVTRKIYKSTNFAATGMLATFSGIVDKGDGTFLTGVVLSGTDNAKHLDSCYVAQFDASLNLIRVFRDGRQSYSSGRNRSQYYGQIVEDGNNNAYVFSGGTDASTTQHAGVLRINSGATSFDAGYYWDIESASQGYKFKRVFHIDGDYFLLEFYNTTGTPGNTATATQYAIANVTGKTLTWLTAANGFPSYANISSVGWPTFANDKAYIPVNTTTEKPTIYVIDPTTGKANKGLVVDASEITVLQNLNK